MMGRAWRRGRRDLPHVEGVTQCATDVSNATMMSCVEREADAEGQRLDVSGGKGRSVALVEERVEAPRSSCLLTTSSIAR